ncbi:MAG: tetratricopeptide repeat protein, partial [Planctomycetota bacterium]
MSRGPARRTSRRRRCLAALTALLLVGALAACSSAERAAEHESNGLMLLQEGRGPEAIEEFERAIDLDPGAHRAAMTLARIYSRSRPTKAIEVLEALNAKKPDIALARIQLGDLFASLGFEQKALVQYDAAAGLADYSPAYLRMATIFESRREDAKAEKALLGALEVAPNDSEALYRLAQLYERADQPGQARRAWELYLKAGEGTTGRPLERTREAEARVRALAANMTELEMREAINALRAELSPNPTSVKTPVLNRPFVGRVFVRVYAKGAEEPIRGVGQAATLRAAIREAAGQALRSRVYKLFVANQLDTARMVIAVETLKAEPLAIREGFEGSVSAGGFEPGRDAIELRLQGGARSAVVLPTDAAAAGWEGLREQLDAATLRLGLGSGGWRNARALRVTTLAFADGPGGEGVHVIEGGLPLAPGPMTPGDRLDRLRAGAG